MNYTGQSVGLLVILVEKIVGTEILVEISMSKGKLL